MHTISHRELEPCFQNYANGSNALGRNHIHDEFSPRLDIETRSGRDTDKICFRAKREQLKRFDKRLPESQGQNMALAVCVMAGVLASSLRE
jgi:hypothetical protein